AGQAVQRPVGGGACGRDSSGAIRAGDGHQEGGLTMPGATLILTQADVIGMAQQRCAALGLVASRAPAADRTPLRRPGVRREGRRFFLTLDPTGKSPALAFEAPESLQADLARLEIA